MLRAARDPGIRSGGATRDAKHLVNKGIESYVLCVGGSLVVFLSSPPYLLRVDVVGEARHDPPVGPTQDDDARIFHEVETVAGWQPRVFLVVAHDGPFSWLDR